MSYKEDLKHVIDTFEQQYDVTFFRNNFEIGLDNRNLQQAKLHRFNNVTLKNIDGLVSGKAYFITENGEWLIIPMPYIVTMIPHKQNENVDKVTVPNM